MADFAPARDPDVRGMGKSDRRPWSHRFRTIGAEGASCDKRAAAKNRQHGKARRNAAMVRVYSTNAPLKSEAEGVHANEPKRVSTGF